MSLSLLLNVRSISWNPLRGKFFPGCLQSQSYYVHIIFNLADLAGRLFYTGFWTVPQVSGLCCKQDPEKGNQFHQALELREENEREPNKLK